MTLMERIDALIATVGAEQEFWSPSRLTSI